MPLSSAPPVEPAAGHSPPHENQMATPHKMNAPVATTTAAPTVGPSTGLGLPLLTAAKIRPATRRKIEARNGDAACCAKTVRRRSCRSAPIVAKGDFVRPGLTNSPFDMAWAGGAFAAGELPVAPRALLQLEGADAVL